MHIMRLLVYVGHEAGIAVDVIVDRLEDTIRAEDVVRAFGVIVLAALFGSQFQRVVIAIRIVVPVVVLVWVGFIHIVLVVVFCWWLFKFKW